VIPDRRAIGARSCPVVVFTAPGRVYSGTLEPGPSAAVRVSGATYAPGDSIGGERIVGVTVPKGVGSRRAAAFNTATLRFR
jgi:hypothetical protein